jgi:hypothetical protein
VNKTSRVAIDLGPTGSGTVFLDGADISNRVKGGTIAFTEGRPTRVVLELSEGSDVTGVAEGDLEQVAVPASARDAIVDFLESIDPAELDAASLEGGLGESPMTSALRILVGRARCA